MYKKWIQENPPRRKNTPTKYRKKFMDELNTKISAHNLAKILKQLGYISKSSNGTRFWILEESDSDSDSD